MPSSQDKTSNRMIRKLAYILPAINIEVAESVTGFFIAQSLLEIGNNKSLNEVKKGIYKIFLLKFENAEIQEAINKLIEDKNVIIKNNRYSLDIKYLSELKQKGSEVKGREDKIFYIWTEDISKKYPELTKGDILSLKYDLQLYLNKIFLQHGVACVSLIYPDNKIFQFEVKYTEDELYKSLPDRGVEINDIRKLEFPLFLKETNSDKQTYFSCVLDGVFIYSSVQVDPQLKNFLAANFNKYAFFLDTNVLYSLFDLGNIKSKNEIEKLLIKVKDLGIKLCVSGKTVKEMKKSVELKGDELARSLTIKRGLADIGADLALEDNFITAYWRAFNRTGISKDDFIQKFSHIDELLKFKEIEVVYDTPDFPNDLLEEEKNKLMSFAASKTHNTAEHDAYHKLLINYLRDSSKKDGTFNKYWFLTIDRSLDIYSREAREKGESPFSMMLHQFLQILRPITDRTQDFDKTFFELFSRPHIKSSKNILPFNMVEQIMATISSYQDLPDSLAVDIIMDGKLREVILKDGNVGSKESIEDLVKKELSGKIKEMEERIKLLEEKSKQGEENMEKAKTEFSQRLKENEEVITTNQGKLEEKDKNLSKSTDELNQTRAKIADKEKSVLEKNRQINILRCSLIVSLFLILITANVLFYIYLPNNLSEIIIVCTIIIDLMLSVFILNIKWKVSKALSYILVAIALITFIVGGADYIYINVNAQRKISPDKNITNDLGNIDKETKINTSSPIEIQK